jgi:hypothetical protein
VSIQVSGVRRRARRRRPVLEQRTLNPGKGLNLFGSDQLIDEREASAAMNCTVVETGGISKSNGWDPIGAGLVNAPRGLAAYYPTVDEHLLMTVDGDGLKYLNGSVWTAVPPNGVTFAASDRVDFVQAAGKLFIWNGINPGSMLNGLTLTRPLTTISASYGIYYADRQIVGGVDEQSNRVYISSSADVGDFTNTGDTVSTHPGSGAWAGTDARYIDIAPNDGDRVMGFAKYQSLLIIFKERSIYSLEFDTTGAPVVKMVTNAIGCVSHWTIDQVDNDIFFMTRNGVYVLGQEPNFFDQIRTNELSIRIKPLIQTITPTNLNKCTAVWADNIYYCAVPTGNSTTNNKVLTYHRQYTAWLQEDIIQANAFCNYINSSNEEDLYYADENTNTVWKKNTGYAKDGQAIDMFWESKANDFGAFDITKRFVDITLLFRQLRGSVKVKVSIDGSRIEKPYTIPGAAFSGGLGRAALGRALLGGRTEAGSDSSSTNTSTQNVPIRLAVGENGRTIKVRVSNDTAGENFVLLGIDVGYRAYGRNNFPSELRVF